MDAEGLIGEAQVLSTLLSISKNLEVAGNAVSNFMKSAASKFTERPSGSVGTEGTMACGIGGSAGGGVIGDGITTRAYSQVCGIVGPICGASSSINASISSGSVTPGSSSWSLGWVGKFATGVGTSTGVSIANDGGISGTLDGLTGYILGGGLKVCKVDIAK